MRLREAGERRFLARVQRELGGSGGAVLLGIGDDAAVIECPVGHSLVLTCDAAVAGRHFRRQWLTDAQIGSRAVRAAVSDIAAMGAVPAAALLTLIISPDEPERAAHDIVAGAAAACEALGLNLAGGETVSTDGPLTLNVTVAGFVAEGRALTRGAAKPGDALLVSGTLGDSAAGLAALKVGPTQGPDAARVIARHTQPKPRLELARLLADAGVHCAIDVSDGLVCDAGHIADESSVGLVIHTGALPISDECRAVARALNTDPLVWALSGGEDFELLLTTPPVTAAELLERVPRELDLQLTRIGDVTVGSGVNVVGADGQAIDLSEEGWDHFA